MGRYDDITADELRQELTHFARLIVRMDEEGVLPDRSHSVLRLLGELRQMVFAYEVRNTRHDQPLRPHPRARMQKLQAEHAEERGAPSESDSLRVVREALERERELLDALEARERPEDEG
jgi:hypothetical protein